MRCGWATWRGPMCCRCRAGWRPGRRPTALAEGTAQRIFTGAALPPGADTVFMQEDVALEAGGVRLPPGLRRGANTRPAGEDVAAGRAGVGGRVSGCGRRIWRWRRRWGWRRLPVRRRVRVALFSTGDELVEPGAAPGPGAALRQQPGAAGADGARGPGAAVTDLGILPDRAGAIAAALRGAAEGHELILTSGGVSAGEEDHVRAAVEAAGRMVFWRLAIKPGRPVAMGEVAGVPFLGLPGNPVAAFVTFARVARPLLAALGGERIGAPAALPVAAGFPLSQEGGPAGICPRAAGGRAWRTSIRAMGRASSRR